MPPKTHDLKYLLELSGLSLEKNFEEFIVEISNLSVVTRYPEDFQNLLKAFSYKRTLSVISKTKEVFQWIKKTILL